MDTLILYSRTGDEIPMKKTVDAVRGATIDPPDKPYAKIIIRDPAETGIDIVKLQIFHAVFHRNIDIEYDEEAIARLHLVILDGLRATDAAVTRNGFSGPHKQPPFCCDITGYQFAQKQSNMYGSPCTHSSWSQWDVGGTSVREEQFQDVFSLQEQLSHTNNQMNVAMKQMYASMDLINRSMRELQSLQQRIEALEATQQEQPQLLPTASLTSPPIRYQSGPTASGSSAMSPAGAAPSDGENSGLQLPPLENGQEYWPQTDHELNLELSGMQWPS
ncbi:hypothetical protein PHLGIDRAFT_15036 [Phlebiopsis gigantea 11061_1 CR5-6]|uniref:Uncharacterized protein n=1 Tax=Phlebiopsis gigantea (strain 11061_1 CR5-6) TaxID=745531 RepID=A0A0C3S7E4_PHLG1|nr:hypothetical protein PHLGIDRAFT_15036 [Phlebiopsis gigantea 11061_1 CR5-6]